MAQVEAGDQTQEVDLDTLDPAELDAEEAEQGGLDAGTAVGQAGVGSRAKILADGVGRKRNFDLWHGPQHARHEGIAVGSRPDPIIAGVIVLIGRDLRLHFSISAAASAPHIEKRARAEPWLSGARWYRLAGGSRQSGPISPDTSQLDREDAPPAAGAAG
jgi:hypothetical protein